MLKILGAEVAGEIEFVLYKISTNLNGKYKTPCAFRTILDPLGYIKIRSQRLLGMAINVFVKKDHILHVRDIEDQYIRFNVKEAVSLLTEIKEKTF